jgi:hypothetical protein
MSLAPVPASGEAGSLVPHTHRLTLRGEPGSVRWPALCAHCGAAASGTLTCSKAFRRTQYDGPAGYVITSAEVPFCAACIERHRAEMKPPPRWLQLAANLASHEMLGTVMLTATTLFVGYLGLKFLLRPEWVGAALLLALAAVFGSFARLQGRQAWQATSYLRIPAQSEVTRAFDFSDNVASAFEPPRFVCTVRDARFAAALRALNLEREWKRDSPSARADRQAAIRKSWWMAGLVVGLALLAWVTEILFE